MSSQSTVQTIENKKPRTTTARVLKKMRTSVSRDEISQLNSIQINTPNFLVIGAQKGGTTWLHANLKKHPEVLLPGGKKELEFFSYHATLNSSNLSDYLSNFNKINNVMVRSCSPKAIGEATPSYFWSVDSSREWSNPPSGFNSQIPASVFNMLGADVKLILCLRNPVHRAISAYLHHIRFARIDYTQQRILDIGKSYGIIDMGFYYQHLSVWLETFKLSNFKILFYEKDIKVNKQKTIKTLCDFLGIDAALYPTSDSINDFHNKGLTYKFTDEGVKIKENPEAAESLVISTREIEAIHEIYHDDTVALEQLLGTDLSDWKL